MLKIIAAFLLLSTAAHAEDLHPEDKTPAEVYTLYFVNVREEACASIYFKAYRDGLTSRDALVMVETARRRLAEIRFVYVGVEKVPENYGLEFSLIIAGDSKLTDYVDGIMEILFTKRVAS